jgi:hypothetical protein
MAWIWSCMCLTLLCTSTQSSNVKWVSGGGINSPRCPKSCWLKVAKSSTIRWSDAMLFRASVHPVLLAITLHYTWPLAQIIRCFNWRIVGSSGAKDFVTKTLLIASSRSSDQLMHTPSVHLVLKSSEPTTLCLDSLSHRIDRPCPYLDRRFIWCYYLLLLCFFHSSDACKTWTVSSSDGSSYLESSRSVQSTPTLAPTLTSRYHRLIRWCPSFFIFHGFDPWKIYYLLTLACGIFAFMGPRKCLHGHAQ